MSENMTKFMVVYEAVMLILLFSLFYSAGIGKVLYVFLILTFAVQIPGSVILYKITGKFDKSTVFFGLAIGFVNAAFIAYLFGVFGINFRYSFILSLGIPYLCLLMQKGFFKQFKNMVNKIEIKD